ncbi:FliO/MopB family protein [Desulfovibrio cuneatus]|uniref:FliO/MopB family protein n=1 Tax=Desulfovibrio cuneatus TaxID=159728 RepID=UPI000402EC87|nr:flagellar biosynthetic protein FliO [Desulfovibrio cuneatus]
MAGTGFSRFRALFAAAVAPVGGGALSQTVQQTQGGGLPPALVAPPLVPVAGAATPVPVAPAAPTTEIVRQGAENISSAVQGVGDLFSWSSYLEMVGMLFLLLAVLWFALWLIKRRAYKAAGGAVPAMYIESRLPLAPKKWVVITRFMNTRLVLGLTDSNITLLAALDVETGKPAPPDKAQGEADSAFADFLRNSQPPTP